MTTNFVIGGRYNWKGQPERLIYIGPMRDMSGLWHQFVKVDKPNSVWCEVTTQDLSRLEPTAQSLQTKADKLTKEEARVAHAVSAVRN